MNRLFNYLGRPSRSLIINISIHSNALSTLPISEPTTGFEPLPTGRQAWPWSLNSNISIHSNALSTLPISEPTTGFEPVTSSLPRKRSTPELHRPKKSERPGSNRRQSAWKAEALPTELLSQYFFYHSTLEIILLFSMLCGERRIRTFEACAADLQSALVGHLSISPFILFKDLS